MTKALTILKILLVVAALICFGICIFGKRDCRRKFLPLGLMFNALAFLINYIMTERT